MIYLQQKLETLPRHQQTWIRELLAFIHQSNDPDELAVSRLANRFRMSERQFYRKVKQNLGTTPNQLIRKVKMQKARELLEIGAYGTVAELAYEVGYNQPEYFSTVFQTTFGKRPSYFLKNPSRIQHSFSSQNGRNLLFFGRNTG